MMPESSMAVPERMVPMRPLPSRSSILAIAFLGLFLCWVASASAADGTKAQNDAPENASGLRVFIDPETGEHQEVSAYAQARVRTAIKYMGIL